jgi:hypothetical protein
MGPCHLLRKPLSKQLIVKVQHSVHYCKLFAIDHTDNLAVRYLRPFYARYDSSAVNKITLGSRRLLDCAVLIGTQISNSVNYYYERSWADEHCFRRRTGSSKGRAVHPFTK